MAVPVGIALVGVLVDLVLVHVADQDGDGIVDQAQAFLATAEGGGDALVVGIGAAEVGVGVFELRRPAADALFKVVVLVFGQMLDIALLGDVAVERHETFVMQRFAAQLQGTAVGSLALADVRDKAACCRDAFGNLPLAVAGAVLAAFGVVADETLERCTDISQLAWKFEQAEEWLIPRHQAQIGIEDRNPLVEQVESCLQDFVAMGGFGRRRRGGHPVILSRVWRPLGSCNHSLHFKNSCVRVFCDPSKKQ